MVSHSALPILDPSSVSWEMRQSWWQVMTFLDMLMLDSNHSSSPQAFKQAILGRHVSQCTRLLCYYCLPFLTPSFIPQTFRRIKAARIYIIYRKFAYPAMHWSESHLAGVKPVATTLFCTVQFQRESSS